ncbi:MAG: hypothetical protein LBB81_11450 [Treponema sp.]|jgi:hypothetical protein|nr:hypothetical protein [Treponema sp.]
MQITPFTLLNLCAPLRYVRSVRRETELLKNEELKNGEILLCYEVNPVQGCSIEPDRERFLGKLLFTGEKSPETPGRSEVSLPQGVYLFSQSRADTVLTRDEWLDLAIEQQKDGLWERNKPGNLLYIRFLFEDGAFVTQVLRAIEN